MAQGWEERGKVAAEAPEAEKHEVSSYPAQRLRTDMIRRCEGPSSGLFLLVAHTW